MTANSAFLLLKQAFDDVLLVDKLSQVQKDFPNARLAPSRSAAAEYVAKIAPDIVYTYMICQFGGFKQCSAVSPYFAAKASDDGFATLVTAVPNHQYNVMLTEEGPLAVDLTRLQFEAYQVASRILEEEDEKGEYNEEDPYGELRADQILKEQLIKNPFRTVRIWATNDLDGFAPNRESISGKFVRHFNPKLQQTDHPEYGSESDISEMYELMEDTELSPG
jgi:hypothetical protein